MLGLKKNVNLLVEYDPEWAIAFAEEKARLEQAFRGVSRLVRGIEHQGSTSVPGLRAKPIIDILVGISPFAEWMACKAPLEELGYDYVPDAGVPMHYIFGRGRDWTERTHLLHLVDFKTDEWRVNLLFREALRSDAGLRARYVAEKERAAAASPVGRVAYTAIKAPFIARVKSELVTSTAEPVRR